MLLIKELPYTNHKVTNAMIRQGLFECPACKEHVVKPLRQGNINKSCGSKECRKVMFVSGNSNATRTKEAIYSKPHIHQIKRLYTTNSFNTYLTFREFHEIVFEEVHKASAIYTTISIELIDNNKPLTSTNFRVVQYKDMATTMYNERLSNELYDSGVLAFTLGKEHRSVKRVVERYLKDNNKGVTKVTYVVKGIRSRTIVAIVLTQQQYNEVMQIIKASSHRNTSSNLYIIESAGMYKIGIAHDVKVRARKLSASSPIDVTVSAQYRVTNARELEKFLHKKYSSKNVKYEWFSLDDSDIATIHMLVADNLEDGLWSAPVIEVPYVKPIKKISKVPLKHIPVTPANSKEIFKRQRNCTTPEWRQYKNLLKIIKDTGLPVVDNLDNFHSFKEVFAGISGVTIRLKEGAREISVDSLLMVDRETYSKSNVKGVVGIREGSGSSCTYQSAAEAAKAVGGTAGHITACCRGRRKSHKGYSWEYLDNKY